jgi:hypothetical protein
MTAYEPGLNTFANVAVMVVAVDVTLVVVMPPIVTEYTPLLCIPIRFVPESVSTSPLALIDPSVITGGLLLPYAETAKVISAKATIAARAKPFDSFRTIRPP